MNPLTPIRPLLVALAMLLPAAPALAQPAPTAPVCAAYYYNALLPFALATAARDLVMPYMDWATATLDALPRDQQIAALGPMQREMQTIVPADQLPGLGNVNWHAIAKAMAARYDEACAPLANLPPLDTDAILAAAESIKAK